MSYLRTNQSEELKIEIQTLERTLQQELAERPAVEVQLARQRKSLIDQEAPDTSPAERDELAKEEAFLREFMLDGENTPMPSEQQMRQNPPGVVGAHMRWEKKVKRPLVGTPFGDISIGAFMRWKQVMLTLRKGDTDPDAANFEIHRPRRDPYASLEGAQIPGKVFIGTHPTEAYRDGHTRTFGSDEEKDLVARKAQLQQELAILEAEEKARLGASAPSPRKPGKLRKTAKRKGRTWTPEQRAEAADRSRRLAAERKTRAAAAVAGEATA